MHTAHLIGENRITAIKPSPNDLAWFMNARVWRSYINQPTSFVMGMRSMGWVSVKQWQNIKHFRETWFTWTNECERRNLCCSYAYSWFLYCRTSGDHSYCVNINTDMGFLVSCKFILFGVPSKEHEPNQSKQLRSQKSGSVIVCESIFFRTPISGDYQPCWHHNWLSLVPTSPMRC